MVIKLPRSRESTPVAVTPPSTSLACRGQRVEDVAVRLLASALQTKLFEEVRVQRRWSLPKSLSPFLSILLLLQRDERRSQSCQPATPPGSLVRLFELGNGPSPLLLLLALFLPGCLRATKFQRISPHVKKNIVKESPRTEF